MNRLSGLQMVNTKHLRYDYYTGTVLYKHYYRDPTDGSSRYKVREYDGLVIGVLSKDGMHLYAFDKGQICKLGKTKHYGEIDD